MPAYYYLDGFIGDQNPDQSGWINAAITYVSEHGGGEIRTNCGATYTFSQKLILQNGVYFTGFGSRFQWTGSNNPTAVMFENTVPTRLREFAMDGIRITPGPAFAGTVFKLHSAWDCMLRRLHIDDATQATAFHFIGDTANETGAYRHCNRNVLEDIDVTLIGRGIILEGIPSAWDGSGGVTNHRFRNVHLNGCTYVGVDLVRWADSHHFEGCNIGITGENGIGVHVNSGDPANHVGVENIHFNNTAIVSHPSVATQKTIVLNRSRSNTFIRTLNDSGPQLQDFIDNGAESYIVEILNSGGNRIRAYRKGNVEETR